VTYKTAKLNFVTSRAADIIRSLNDGSYTLL